MERVVTFIPLNERQTNSWFFGQAASPGSCPCYLRPALSPISMLHVELTGARQSGQELVDNMDNPHWNTGWKEAGSKEGNSKSGEKNMVHNVCWGAAEAAAPLYRSCRWAKPALPSYLSDISGSKKCAVTFREMSFLYERVQYFPANVISRRKLRNLTPKLADLGVECWLGGVVHKKNKSKN